LEILNNIAGFFSKFSKTFVNFFANYRKLCRTFSKIFDYLSGLFLRMPILLPAGSREKRGFQ